MKMALLSHTGILSLLALGALASPMDKYQGRFEKQSDLHFIWITVCLDALQKYSKWVEKFGNGGLRSQRNTDISSYIFVPHR